MGNFIPNLLPWQREYFSSCLSAYNVSAGVILRKMLGEKKQTGQITHYPWYIYGILIQFMKLSSQ